MVRQTASTLMSAALLGGLIVTAACDHSPSSAAPSSVPQTGATGGSTTSVLTGAISGLTAPSGITVSGQQMQLDPNATLRSGTMPISFADLKIGANSRVMERTDSSGMHATEVDVLDPVGTATHLHGFISGVSGDANGFQFQMGGSLVKGDSGTQVFSGTSPASASALQNGQIVDVDGLQRADYVYPSNVTIKA